jgi:polysaccharide pyruvyl transferase WcaK-like protein
MKKAVDLLLEKSEFILVRDKESKELLGNHSKVMVGPDLTFLFSYDLANPTEEKVVGLNLRDWNWLGGEGGTLRFALLNRLGKSFKWLKKIWPSKKWNEERFVSMLHSFKARVFPMPLYFEQKSSFLVSDVAVLRRYFDLVPDTFDISFFEKIRCLVAMRYHALLFSVQCGIPFVCLSYQPKCARFCQSIGMSHYSLDLFDYDKIVDRLLDLENNYHTIRQNLVLHRRKLSNDINCRMSEILSIVEGDHRT